MPSFPARRDRSRGIPARRDHDTARKFASERRRLHQNSQNKKPLAHLEQHSTEVQVKTALPRQPNKGRSKTKVAITVPRSRWTARLRRHG